MKELGEERTEIGAVFRSALLNPLAELLALEDSVVFGEEAEEDANEKELEGMAAVARVPEQVVEFAEFLGGLDVDRVLRLDFLRLIAGDEAEEADVLYAGLEGQTR